VPFPEPPVVAAAVGGGGGGGAVAVAAAAAAAAAVAIPALVPLAVLDEAELVEGSAPAVATAAAAVETGVSPAHLLRDDTEAERVILVAPQDEASLSPLSIQAAARSLALTAAIAKGMVLEEGGTEEDLKKLQKRRRRSAALVASRVALPSERGGKEGGRGVQQVIPSLLALLSDPLIVQKKKLRPFYRACIQATGHKLNALPSREDPSLLLPLSLTPTHHLGLLAVAFLVTDSKIISLEGWGALRKLFRAVLSVYGVRGGKVPVWEKGGGREGGREGGAAKLKSVLVCGGAELGDVLLALLAQEEGMVEVVGEGGREGGKKSTTKKRGRKTKEEE